MVDIDDVKKLKEIIKDHERRLSKLEQIKNLAPKNNAIQSNSLLDLLNNSFFDEPKKFGQIIKQLKTNATFSTQLNYKKTLVSLVQEKKLSRKQVGHQWMYIKYG